MNKLALAILICMIILLRPYVMQSSGLWYYGDDQDYFAHAASIVYGQFPSYKNEYLTIDKNYPQSSIGCSLLAVPFVWVFSFLDKFGGSDIAQHRSLQNIPGSWTQYGFILASCFYFCLGCFLLYRAQLFYVAKRYALLSVILVVLCEGLPLYPFRRPMFSHTAEFFLQSLFVFIVLKKLSSDRSKKSPAWQFLVWGMLGALILLTRYNNVIYAVGWPLVLILIEKPLNQIIKMWPKILLTMGGFVAMVGTFKLWPEIYNHYHPYPWIMHYLARTLSFADIVHRLGHIFAGIDWGMIYTAPYILLGIIAAIAFAYPHKKYFWWAIAALAVNFYIIIVWGDQGSWHGYRYIIASAAPLLVLPVAFFIKTIEERVSKQLTWVWALLAVTAALSMICFESDHSTFALYLAPVDLGETDFTNYLYQYHIWQTLLFEPIHILGMVCLAGIEYGQFIMTHVMQQFGLFPNVFFRHYSAFNIATFIKLALIYMLPFGMAFFFREKTKE